MSLAATMGCPLPVLTDNSTSPPYDSQLTCLRSQPALTAFASVASTVFTAVVDSVLLPNFPALLLRSGQFAVVPTLIGSTPAELTNFYALGGLPLPPPSYISWPVVSAIVAGSLGARTAYVARVASFYTQSVYEAQFNISDPVTAALDVINDYVIRCPTHRLAQYSAHTQLYSNQTQAHVWSWLWQYLPVHQYPALVANDVKQAAHGQDLPFVFDQPNLLSNFTFTAEEHALSAVWMNVIARFVSAGNPNTAITALDNRFAAAYHAALQNSTVPIKAYQLPTWPAYSVDETQPKELLLNIQTDAAVAVSHTVNSSTVFVTATTNVPVAPNSTGFSTLPASLVFGIHCDSVASAALPLDNTAQSRLSACRLLQDQGADVCLSEADSHNVCIDHFNNTFSCHCSAALGYSTGVASLSCVAPSVSRASGDPQLVGLLGQSFQVHGINGAVYNFVTHARLQLNARFLFLGGMAGDYQCVGDTDCWSHPGNYISAIGLSQRLGTEQVVHIQVVAGSAAVGFSAITVNGAVLSLPSASIHEWSSASTGEVVQLELHGTHSLSITTPLLSFRFDNSDGFLNYELSARVALNQLHTHGLLGQTWQIVNRQLQGRSKLPIEGDVDDYAISGDDIFGSEHTFNRFMADLTTQSERGDIVIAS